MVDTVLGILSVAAAAGATKGRVVNISEVLAETSVSSLDLSRFVSVTPDATVETTVETMAAVKWSCAFIMEGSHIGGIFTQRDALQRAVGRPGNWQREIREEMTVAVQTMRDTDSVADGLKIMNDWWVRSVPVLDDDTAHSLAARVFQAECEAYPEAIRLYAAGRLEIEDHRVRTVTLPAE